MFISNKKMGVIIDRFEALEKRSVQSDIERVKLDRKIIELEAKLSARIEETNVDVVTCEVCGCLLERSVAIQGASEIREVMKYSRGYGGYFTQVGPVEEIHHPYYCKVHAPKPKGKNSPKKGGK